MDAIENELDAERASGEETIHAGPFVDLPVLILSRDPTVLSSNWPTSVAKANLNRLEPDAGGIKGSVHSEHPHHRPNAAIMTSRTIGLIW